MKWRKRPVVVDAVQWTGDNIEEMRRFVGDAVIYSETDTKWEGEPRTAIKVKTLEGVMDARIGDFIIKGVGGEFYPCKQDIFLLTYEQV